MTKKRQGDQAVPAYPDSLGPNIHSGGEQEIGAPVPPYEGRQTEGKSEEELSRERGNFGHEAGPRDISQAEKEGVPPTDTTARSPHGVGESTGSQGNEESLGMSEEARRQARLETDAGVGPNRLRDSESPNMQPGDQGG